MESTVGQARQVSRSLTAELATSSSSGEKLTFWFLPSLFGPLPFSTFSRLLSFSSRHRSFCLVTSDPVLFVLAAIGGEENPGKGVVEEEMDADVIG
jgi:hypothetical protein